MANAHTVDVSTANFREAVIEASKKAPVVVDFWAPWCGPCRALGPVLEKLAAEYGGQFTLAKINSDENQPLAAEYGVRGIPNVKAFVDGQVVDEFSGALPEGQVREWLRGILPTRGDKLLVQAVQALAAGDAAGALGMIEEAAREEPDRDDLRLARAEALIALARYDEARAALDACAALVKMEDAWQTVESKLALASASAAAPDAATLQALIAANPGDLDARLALASAAVAKQDYAAALDELLEIVRRDRTFRDDVGRKTIVQIFNVLGPQHPLVPEYRRRLASAMY
jgi:putative thioredoxin